MSTQKAEKFAKTAISKDVCGETKNAKPKQSRLLQTACPSVTLAEALAVPQAIKDNFAGQATVPLLVAEACGVTPASSNWRVLTGAAVAYGLTNGAYNSKEISITPLGERIVAPLVEGDSGVALKEAALRPTILGELYHQYDKNKLPKIEIAYNVLQKKGIPPERLENAWNIFRANATQTNMLRIIGGNEYLYLDLEGRQSDHGNNEDENPDLEGIEKMDVPDEVLEKMNIVPPAMPMQQSAEPKRDKPNIFISHGKSNSVIVGQLKELLSYGQMEPIVSVERETTAIPVPDKVFDDMRNCDAGIIHIDLEEVPIGEGEQTYRRLNENVLIEIGAAIALYGKRVILLCKKGTILPSNLQGLYRCEYEGNQLDYTATMKLLKTMQELRTMM